MLRPLGYLAILGIILGACQSAPTAEEVPRPNILFAIADDASFPHMGAYGCTWVNTPGFDRVAENGLLFTNAYTPNAKCAPSRSCILTGRNSWQLEEAANHIPYFPDKFTTFMESLDENGYFVGHTAKGWAPGQVGEINGKKRQLTGPAFNDKKTDPPAEHISNNDYAENFRDFLTAKPDSLPFCFWYGSLEPHRRYEYGVGIEKGGKQLSDIDDIPNFWPQNDTVRTDMLDYAFEIEYFDQHLANMLDMLEEAGELANTIVIVTADNGMPFPRVKGQAYELSNHLPFAIMWPEGIQQSGKKVEEYISFIDIAPTLMELAQVSTEESGMQAMQGRSLSYFFEEQSADSATWDYVLLGKERHDIGRPNDWGYPIRGIVKNDYLYIRNYEPDRWPAGNPETGYLNTDGSPTKTFILNNRQTPGMEQYWKMNFGQRPTEEFYNIGNDPDCVRNLAFDPEVAPIMEAMKTQMVAELKAQGDPRMFGRGEIFDEYVYANESTRGFYERYMDGEELNAGWVNPTDFQEIEME
ncbi:sulfatase family protein [Tunicatimonas pelagia]|uniref:sulfatase family protein n=1 Tax=Tunicatimonas pelagia TaxID=931531 RepID=UPI0026657A2E|nr:sulfatase [Tunicatimonas pelagia]WKN41103.1 sulfatase [Tunicatimonas pelagia]